MKIYYRLAETLFVLTKRAYMMEVCFGLRTIGSGNSGGLNKTLGS